MIRHHRPTLLVGAPRAACPPGAAAEERPDVVVGAEHAEPVSAGPVRTIYADEVLCATVAEHIAVRPGAAAAWWLLLLALCPGAATACGPLLWKVLLQ